MTTLYFYDVFSDDWVSVDNFLPDDITEAMLAANRCRGCACSDADIEYGYRSAVPDVMIVHDPDCAA
jgi:hypothetical protein